MKRILLLELLIAVALTITAQGTVTDCQGHIYPVVKIGNQYWMAENLQCTKYDTQSERAGAEIYTSNSYTYAPYYTDGRYANTEYSGNLTNEQRKHLGLLYNWAAAMGYTESQAQNQTVTTADGRASALTAGICQTGLIGTRLQMHLAECLRQTPTDMWIIQM